MADYTAKLTPAIPKMTPRTVWWDPGMEDSFIHLRKSLVCVCMLTVPKHEDVFTLHTDATLMSVGRVLNVFHADEEMEVGFYARQLTKADLNYSATELEVLAVTNAVEHFAHCLYGWDGQITVPWRLC